MWDAVIAFPPHPRPSELVFRLGVAYPVRDNVVREQREHPVELDPVRPIGVARVYSIAEQGQASFTMERLSDELTAVARQRQAMDRVDHQVVSWLEADVLPCKANLLTRLEGIDEVLAPLDAQSVYFDAPNPLREGRCAR